jgi:hypothetical protein
MQAVTYYQTASGNMTTRKPAPASAPEPIDPNESLLVSLDELIAIASAQRGRPAAAQAQAQAPKPVLWTPSTVAAAAALPVPVELPSRYPARGPGAQAPGGPVFIAAPKDLSSLDHAACPQRRNDPLLAVLRAALLNDWHGQAIHSGPAAAAGGVLPLSVLLTVLNTQPSQQKARKWAQILTGSGQTNILAQCANVSGRFAICRPEGLRLVRDFYDSPAEPQPEPALTAG